MKLKQSLIALISATIFVVANTLTVLAQQSTSQIWLSSEMSQVSPGQEFIVTVNVSGAVGVFGGSFKLAYDPEALEVVTNNDNAITAGSFFGTAPSFALKNSADAQTGIVEYALTLTQPAQPVNGDGVLGTITFRALKATDVTITPVEARLLSPEFTEVNGRLIAQRINEVDAQTQAMTVAIMDSNTSQPVVSAPASNPVSVSASASASAAEQRPAQPAMNSAPDNDMMMFIVAGLLFLVGLGLFATSVGTYVSLRRQPTLREARSESMIW